MILKVIQEGTPTKKYTDIKSTATFVEKSFKEGKYSFTLMYKDFECDPNPVLIGIKDLAILKQKGVSTYEDVIEQLGLKEVGSDMEIDTHYKSTISEIQIGS
jgi:hypothetical protein